MLQEIGFALLLQGLMHILHAVECLVLGLQNHGCRAWSESRSPPAIQALHRAPVSVRLVRKMFGSQILAGGLLDLAAAASKPSITGISASSRTRSGARK